MNMSQRIKSLPISATRKLLPYAVEAKKKGVTIYHLNVGDPDIETPLVMLDVLRNWKLSTIRYTPSVGEKKFLDALLQYYYRLGFNFLTKDNLVATVGGTEAVAMSVFATCDVGDEIIVFEPYYSGYLPQAALYGVKLIPVSTDIENGFHLPAQKEIIKKITPRTKAILYCSPANPTGTVYTKEEIKMLVTIAKNNKLFLISDEVYREFVFVDRKHVSLLNYLQEIPEVGIVIDSLSKRYSLCGARLGTFISLNKDIISGVIKMTQARLSGGLVDQIVGSKLTEVPPSYTIKVQKEYRKRRDFLYKELSTISGIIISQPEGAFYSMIKLPVQDAEKFCIWLLESYRNNNETIMFAPGAGFYLSPGKGLNEVRLAYILDIKKLKRCVDLLKDALYKYSLVRNLPS